MNNEYLCKTKESIRTKNYENAAFYLSYLAEDQPTYEMLIPVMLYENEEYIRALTLLKDKTGKTAYFYKGLCAMKLKKLEKAIEYLKKSQSCDFEEKCPDIYFYKYFVTSECKFYTQEIINDCIQTSGISNRGDRVEVFNETYSITSFMNSINQNNLPFNDIEILKKNSQIEFFSDYFKIMENPNPGILKKYKRLIPGVGSLFYALIGKFQFDIGNFKSSNKFFSLINVDDPAFNIFTDIFSSSAYLMGRNSQLEIMARLFLTSCRYSENAWKIVGNYYSLKSDHAKAILCLKRSLCIKETCYAYSLLGYEHITIKENKLGLEYFFKALKINPLSYNAYLGIALIYSNMEEEKYMANFYFKKSMEINGVNKRIQYFYFKYLCSLGKQTDADNLLCHIYRMEGLNTMNIKKYFNENKKDELDEKIFKEYFSMFKVPLPEISTEIYSLVESLGVFKKKL